MYSKIALITTQFIVRLAVQIIAFFTAIFGAFPEAKAQDSVPAAIIGMESTLPEDKAVGSVTAGDKLRELLSAELSREVFHLQLVDRGHVDLIMKEHKVQLSGVTDAATNLKTAGLLGAKVLIFGRVYSMGDEVWTSAKLFQVRTGNTESVLVKKPAHTALSILASELAVQIAKKLNSTSADNVSETDVDIARINEKLGTRKRPTVEIEIGFSKPLDEELNRALRLEASYLLMRCKFPVEISLTEKPRFNPDSHVTITLSVEVQTTARIESQFSCNASVQLGGGRFQAYKARRTGMGGTEREAARAALMQSLYAAGVEFLPSLTEPGAR